IVESSFSKPNVFDVWAGRSTFEKMFSGESLIDTFQKEVDIYENALLNLKASGDKFTTIEGVLFDKKRLEKALAESKTNLNNAFKEQNTYIEQYKQGLRASLDINDDFKDLNQNALSSFIESIGDNLKNLSTKGNKIDSLDLAEYLGDSEVFVSKMNGINKSFEENQKNVDLTKKQYQDWRNESIKSLSDILLYQGKLGSRKLANDLAKQMVDGLGKIETAGKKATDSLSKYEKALSDFQTKYKENADKIKELSGFLNELNDKGLTQSSIDKIISDYQDYIPLLENESELRKQLVKDTKDYQNAIYDAYVKTKEEDVSFYNQVKNNHTALFNHLNKLYGNNVTNWANLAQAREEIELQLINKLGSEWAKYFDSFSAGTLLVNPTSGADFRRIESGSVLAVDEKTNKILKDYADFQKATRDIASKFKNLNVSSSLGNKSSSSSSATEKELYDSKLYEKAIASLDQQLALLNDTKEKAASFSQEYRDSLQKEITLLQQKQKLAHEEADRLRNQKSSKISEINKLAGTDWYSLDGAQQQKIFDSLYNAKKNLKQKQFNDLLKDVDSLDKSIVDLGNSWSDWQDKVDGNKIAQVTSKLEHFDKAISNINDKLQRNKSEMQNLIPGTTTTYSAKLQEQITLTKEYIQALQEKQKYLEVEIALETTNIARKNELIDILKNVKQALFDVKIDLTSQLAAQADEVISIYKDMYEKQKDLALDAIDAQIDAEEKRHKQTTDNLDDELSQYNDLIDAKLKLLDETEAEEEYQKSLMKAQQERQDIQNQIDVLSLDDSPENRIKLADLKKQLAKKDEDIQDKQHKHTLDLRKANLQNMIDIKKKETQVAKNAEDDQYDALKDNRGKQKTAIVKYWDDMINDEARFANIRQQIISGNLNGIESDF
ncbi:MAG: hypothetical protein PHN56_07335, partial [Candidatus Nanoarchaeia archaeon]|nr:hypothetical protein [Candidatus Nanoarchaeia archaeon]